MSFRASRYAFRVALLLLAFGSACPLWSKEYEDKLVAFTYPDTATVQTKPESGSYVVFVDNAAVIVVVISDEVASLDEIKAKASASRQSLKAPPDKRPEEFRQMELTRLSDLQEVKIDEGIFYLATAHIRTPDGDNGVLTLGFGSLKGKVAFYQFVGMDASLPVEQHWELLKTLRSKRPS